MLKSATARPQECSMKIQKKKTLLVDTSIMLNILCWSRVMLCMVQDKYYAFNKFLQVGAMIQLVNIKNMQKSVSIKNNSIHYNL